ncbi:ribosomal protein S18 acetylase RimI-like enzyme [Parabacteroides sp. PFB2-12]|uniref:GNAT family N-acetyltransferase n=1 Tax=unclassified Parabacteroides TaxID=2649774 RepID=UPI002474E302|nr:MULTISPECIES: GNAT family N-acetyltransferase [unclassified Parabacteroides]MDH6342669.1 ribosomal protein S18 acetylase RimI-like enzyme [Parabacteroides sp. PM6-13]MDH6389732.1 ribosomal protein S18 acetylase RimI-like enzyme [Parabacteroides sp. PFB2-12]
MEIKSLAKISFDQLFEAFSQAFAQYDIQIDKEEFRTMIRRRGYDPALSFAAFDGNRIVSFTCNGIGDYHGKRMAYDTGTGTLAEYRGQGLATKVFEASIPYLKEAGVTAYILEVLQHNTGAFNVYKKIGFEVTREFYYYKEDNGKVNIAPKTLPVPYVIQPIYIDEYKDTISTFWDFHPSWQNSFESIERTKKDFIYKGVFSDGNLIGYSVFEPGSGDVTQLAVHPRFRRKGIGSILLQEMVNDNRFATLKIVNTDIACDSVKAFLSVHGIEPKGKQYEMIKKL